MGVSSILKITTLAEERLSKLLPCYAWTHLARKMTIRTIPLEDEVKAHMDTIDLAQGSPALELLPMDLLTASFNALQLNGISADRMLDYGPSTGDDAVRKVIAEWLYRRYGLPQPDLARVCVTGGASQNLACILQCYASLGDTKAVYLATPTYYLVFDIFEDHGYADHLRGIPEDDQGLDVDLLETKMRADSLSWGAEEVKAPQDVVPVRTHTKPYTETDQDTRVRITSVVPASCTRASYTVCLRFRIPRGKQ